MTSKSTHHPATNTHLNQGCEYREQLGPNADSRTLLAYLSHRYRHSSPAEWATRIASGHVLIDELPAHAESVLRTGCELVWQRPPWIEPDAPKSFSVLYEDDDLIAVNKPAGLPTLPGANFLQSTLLYLVRAYAPDAAPLHRLGRWTSGIVLCARNHTARTELMRQWSANEVDKLYRALANGCPDWDETNDLRAYRPCAARLARFDPRRVPKRQALLVLRDRHRTSRSSFLCNVRIATGRPHQIRIHLAASGHPLVGDPLYGAGGLPLPDTRALPGDPGYHLHAAELSFRHPGTRREVVIECEPPSILRRSG